ncbi:MAG: diacylglycerol kinase family lipid kinase [Bacteroidales bacterium]|nr:diacylglycerol kinase family lipid kinase [Bacteroidales bacterium]MCB9014023.1 diacylglycerol kinase family lipid kinase [Bacteroidales bacterium]
MPKQSNEWVFIINPIAGGGFAKTIVPKLETMIIKYDIEAQIVFTERTGHATEIADQFISKGYYNIVGVGGDGTINEIARAVVGKKNVALGIIPAGTGNDTIQIMGFPNRFEEADWGIFFRAHKIKMDIGSCNGNIFLNGMGLGFDAQVAAENYDESGKPKKGGKNKYIWHIIKTLLFYKEGKMKTVKAGQTTESDCFINTISIGRRFAGGFYLTPRAIANDGLLDVCMIEKLSLLERFAILLKVPKGEHLSNKKVNYYHTPELNLEFNKKVPFHLDGELSFAKNFNIWVLPEAITVIYNPDGNHFYKK